MNETFAWLASPALTEWMPLIIGLIALLESLLLISLLLPGVALLAAASWVAGQQDLSLSILLTCAYVGAVAGEAISFYLGRHWAPLLYRQPVFKRHPKWQHQGEQFFHRYGVLSIFLGRFVGPVRPFIPFIAGSMQMPQFQFWLINLISALIWTPAYLLPGYWLGQQSEELVRYDDRLLQLVMAFGLLILLWHGFHHQLQPTRPLHRRLGWLPEPAAASLLVIGAGTGFLAICLMRSFGIGLEAEQHWQQALTDLASWLHPLAVITTLAGDYMATLCVMLPVAMVLGHKRQWRSITAITLLMLSVIALNSGLKVLYAFPRPELGTLLYSSWSFPSSHASTGAALFAMLAVLLAQGLTEKARRSLYSLMAIPVLMIPLSRVLLNLHWPLDVIAGLLEGLLAAALWQHWLAKHPIQLSSTQRHMLIASVAGCLTLYILLRYPAAQAFYQLS